MSSQELIAEPAMACPVCQQTNTLCGMNDDVKLLIAEKLHSLDDYYRLMVTNSGWRRLLEMNRYLLLREIIVSMTRQWKCSY
jgi:hypothetical protein